jgi:hypothetical protein
VDIGGDDPMAALGALVELHSNNENYEENTNKQTNAIRFDIATHPVRMRDWVGDGKYVGLFSSYRPKPDSANRAIRTGRL